MLSRYFFIFVLVVATVSGSVAAQVGNETVELPGAGASETCDQYITETISLCSAEYDDGHAVLEFDSDRRERVTITEAVALTEFREINRESFVLDGRTTVSLPIALNGGAGGVTVDDGTVLYGIPVKGSDAMFGGPWTSSDAQAAALGAGVSVSFAVLLLVFRASRGKSQEPERVA